MIWYSLGCVESYIRPNKERLPFSLPHSVLTNTPEWLDNLLYQHFLCSLSFSVCAGQTLHPARIFRWKAEMLKINKTDLRVRDIKHTFSRSSSKCSLNFKALRFLSMWFLGCQRAFMNINIWNQRLSQSTAWMLWMCAWSRTERSLSVLSMEFVSPPSNLTPSKTPPLHFSARHVRFYQIQTK